MLPGSSDSFDSSESAARLLPLPPDVVVVEILACLPSAVVPELVPPDVADADVVAAADVAAAADDVELFERP